MSFLLKDLYSEKFYNKFSEVLKQTIPAFDRRKFFKQIFTDDFQNYELKERMTHTANVLRNFMPDDFGEASNVLIELVENLQSAGIREDTIEFMFIPEYIWMFGLNDYKNSVKAIEYITQYTSCEFAVRPFMLKYEDRMLKQMLKWSEHQHRRVRRLASEGSRPRLPWAIAIPSLKNDPAPVLPILENLKHDECDSVRRSVANNLNDISKDNPNVTLKLAKKWRGISPETDAIIKHGLRTLLKRGNSEALKFYQLDGESFKIKNFNVTTPVVKVGEYLSFSFFVSNISAKAKLLRIEYALYFRKSNGSLSKKVFKISERLLKPGERIFIQKRHSFRPITTRVYYSGEHKIATITNGKEHNAVKFTLKDQL